MDEVMYNISIVNDVEVSRTKFCIILVLVVIFEPVGVRQNIEQNLYKNEISYLWHSGSHKKDSISQYFQSIL